MGKGLLYVLTSFSLPPIHSYAGPHGIPAMRCHSSQTDHVWLSHRVQLLKNWSNNCFIPQGSSSRSCSRTWREKPPRVATPPDLLLLSMGCSSGQGLILFFLFFPFIPFYFFFLFVFLFFFFFSFFSFCNTRLKQSLTAWKISKINWLKMSISGPEASNYHKHLTK